MISYLTISNFLSHKKTKLEFSKGVNIIVGPTDSGKSAIIKTLKWVVTNRPMGDGMCSNWGGDTAVTLFIDHQIQRYKGGEGNLYFLNDHKFAALKGDVPVEIQQELNLTDINIQTQFDSHFLLSSSSGEVAQYFNKVAHLNKIDIGLQNIQRWTREVQRRLEYNEQSLLTAQERLFEFAYIEEVDNLLKDLEKNEKDTQELINSHTSLLGIAAALKKIELEAEQWEGLPQLEGIVDSLLNVFFRISRAKTELSKLNDIVASIKNNQGSINQLIQILEEAEDTFHEALQNGECPLCGSIVKPKLKIK